jgi:hypothetical protein
MVTHRERIPTPLSSKIRKENQMPPGEAIFCLEAIFLDFNFMESI